MLKVNYNVESTRVGQAIDYDKLTIEVWTDGTINAQEAVSLAARVLTEHLNLFVNLSDEAAGAEIMVEKTNDDKEKALEMTIEELDLLSLIHISFRWVSPTFTVSVRPLRTRSWKQLASTPIPASRT